MPIQLKVPANISVHVVSSSLFAGIHCCDFMWENGLSVALYSLTDQYSCAGAKGLYLVDTGEPRKADRPSRGVMEISLQSHNEHIC